MERASKTYSKDGRVFYSSCALIIYLIEATNYVHLVKHWPLLNPYYNMSGSRKAEVKKVL